MTQQSVPQQRGGIIPGRGGPMGGGPMRGAMMAGEKPKSFRKTMRTFLKYLKPYWVPLIVVLVFAIASTVFSISRTEAAW